MSLIKELERRLETILEGFFARQFKSGLQPIEIAKRLSREMDQHRTLGVNKVYVPNSYRVFIGPADAEKLSSFTGQLSGEFSDFLMAHAQRESYTVVGRPSIVIEALPGLALGEFKIESLLVDREPEDKPSAAIATSAPAPRRETPIDGTRVMRAVSPGAVLEFPDAGRVYHLTGERTTIGRAAGSDIVIPDQSVSRRHADVAQSSDGYIVEDLGSRNGTYVNGARVAKKALREGDEIKIGMTVLLFRSGSRV